MSNVSRILFLVIIVVIFGCGPGREVQRLQTKEGWSVVVRMKEIDDDPAVGMLGTVYDRDGRQIQPGMCVGSSYDRSKTGGFRLHESNGLVGLCPEGRPEEILILFDYEGNIWPVYGDDFERIKKAYEWYKYAMSTLNKDKESD